MFNRCPDCTKEVRIEPAQYEAVIRQAETGEYRPICPNCGYAFNYTAAKQKAIADEARGGLMKPQ